MNARILLVVSIVLNVVLAGWIATGLRSSKLPAAPAPAGDGESAPRRNEPVRLPKRDGQTGHAVAQAGDVRFGWHSIESADFKEYIANLRAVGCPEETIRDLVFAEVNKLYATKLAALLPAPRRNYWEPEDPYGRRESAESRRQRRELEREKKELFRELLGEAAMAEVRRQSGQHWMAREYGWLPQDKQDSLLDLNTRFSEQEEDFYARTDGVIDSEARKELNKIREQKRAELAKLLSPAEMEEFDLRHSNTAQNLRMNIAGFNPTEDEFKSLYRMRKAYEDEFGSGGSKVDRNDPGAVARYDEGRRKRDEEMKSALGGERYAQYERAREYGWQDLSRLASRYELPKESVNQVWDMRKSAEAAALELRNNTALTEEQRRASLKQIQDETQKAVAAALGEKAFKNYQQSSGYWMQSLGSRSSSRTVTISGDGGTFINDQVILNAPAVAPLPGGAN